MAQERRRGLVEDLVLPTLMFTALGGMTWAIRGCSGFGASAGCIFAGVTWGAAWWYLAYDAAGVQTRRYSSGWIVLAVTLAFGFSGARGWMQWPSFFDGHLDTNVGKHQWVPISRSYGYLWLFIAGVPWAGLAACALAWCGSIKETRVWHWLLRMTLGIGGFYLARYLYDTFPEYFLPLYGELESRYKDLRANPNLGRLINDCGLAIAHLGCYLGFLLYEFLRRDWKNVVLIVTVGLLNGIGWAAFQNWKWTKQVWPGASFNFWRCWESSGGLSIGFAFGIAYYLVNRPMSEREAGRVAQRQALSCPNFEWLLVFCGLAAYMTPFIHAWTASRGALDDPKSYYLPAVHLFAAAYYLLYRRPDSGTGMSGLGGLIGVCVPVAFLIGALIPWPRRAPVRYDLIFNAAVFLVGLGLFLLNRQNFEAEKAATTPRAGDPNLERFGLYLGMLVGLGLSLRNGFKGWFNIYQNQNTLGDLSSILLQRFGPPQHVDNIEAYWSAWLWKWLGPVFLFLLVAVVVWILVRARSRISPPPIFPDAFAWIWLVLIVQNAIAQLVTGPHSSWPEVAFAIYYVLLFLITAIIAEYFRLVKSTQGPMPAL